jgi:large subunit ribosomal protein L29
MKAHELRQLSDDELQKRIAEELENITALTFQKSLGQLENSSTIGKTRKEIARMKTILRERRTSTLAGQS